MEFRVLGFDVVVRGGFLFVLLMPLLASNGSFDAYTLKELLVWAPVVFGSVLIHELGHAFAVRWQRCPASIELYWMGGLTHWKQLLPITRGARILISLAGPFAGFLFGGLIALALYVASATGAADLVIVSGGHGLVNVLSTDRHASIWFWHAVNELLFVNVAWGLVNLLPVLPFDGGHVLEAALGPKRARLALQISCAIGLAIAVYFLVEWRSLWGGYLFGSAALSAAIKLRGSTVATQWKPSATPSDAFQAELDKASAALDADQPARAIELAEKVIAGRSSDTARSRAMTIVVWAELMRGDAGAAERGLVEIRKREEPDRALTGNVALAAGRLSEARMVLEKAYHDGDRRKEVFGPLIQVLLRQDAHARAAEVALERFESLSSDDARQVAELASEGGAHVAAARLYERVATRERSRGDILSAVRAYSKAGERDRAVDALKKAFVSGVVTEADVRSDSELGALMGDSVSEGT